MSDASASGRSAVRFTCHRARHPSQAPDLSFPSTPQLSPLARRIRAAEEMASVGLRGFWRRRRRRRRLLRDCSVLLEKAAGRAALPRSVRSDGYGWQFVRLIWRGDARLGLPWGVYEIFVSEG